MRIKRIKVNFYKNRTGEEFLRITVVGGKIDSTEKSDKTLAADGVLINRNADEFINAITQYRFWQCEKQAL